MKTGDTVELKTELNMPGYGYLEGATAAGAFTVPTTGSTPTAVLGTFEAKGAAIEGTFERGRCPSDHRW
jgi:hypothetical protein